MTHSLLRSGCPDDYLSLGENGQAIFDSALQIRETLRLRNQQAALEILAIPQINDSGDRVDWYAPRSGEAIDWALASESQRASARLSLTHCLAQLRQLSSQCQASEKTSLRLFGLLLDKAMQFPDSQYIWLVDGKPVITFWGFVHQGDAAREDPLACLQTDNPDEMPPEQQNSAPQAESEAVVIPAEKTVAGDAVNSEAATSENRPVLPPERRRLGKGLLACMAMLIAAASGSYWLIHAPQTEQAVPLAHTVADAEVFSLQAAPKATLSQSSLPLMPATVERAILPVAETVKPVYLPPSVKEPLIMPGEELRHGSTQFLNGIWTVQLSGASASPTLRYRIVNNRGTVSLFNQNNARCQAEVFSGLHQSGILMIKARGSARCSDGSRYRLPEIACKAGDKAVAECTGRYPDASQTPAIFEKVSK